MARADWPIIGESNKIERSNVMITITDNAGVVEGKEVVAVCNGKPFTSTMKNGVAKLYTTEVGTYTITVGEYSTMLVCPYFGMFSTDIYSGTLKVTCIEAGGNNKTCHVQSCDDNYEFTDDYNLTQVFDVGLELTFLGIPTGKYLITVDDKYRFFKEITSIQSINEIDVELKQWLFNNGDQCEWNTGGWMQCQATGSTEKRYTQFNKTPTTASYAQEIAFTNNAIRIFQQCIANEACVMGSTYGTYARSKVTSNIYVGTIGKLPISLAKYFKLHYTATQPFTIAVRSGALNDSNTNTSTSTVLISGTANVININLVDVEGMIIMGKGYQEDGFGDILMNGSYTKFPANWSTFDFRKSHGSINYNYTSDVTEIYLS